MNTLIKVYSRSAIKVIWFCNTYNSSHILGCTVHSAIMVFLASVFKVFKKDI